MDYTENYARLSCNCRILRIKDKWDGYPYLKYYLLKFRFGIFLYLVELKRPVATKK